MNKVFKVIWSKTKNCYVVMSELAKSHTKSPKSGVIGKALVAGVLACVLSCGVVLPNVEAAFTQYPGNISTISPDDIYFSPNGSSSLDWTDPTGNMSYSIGVYTYGLKIGDVSTGEAGLADATDIYNNTHVSNGNFINANNSVAQNLTALDNAIAGISGSFSTNNSGAYLSDGYFSLGDTNGVYFADISGDLNDTLNELYYASEFEEGDQYSGLIENNSIGFKALKDKNGNVIFKGGIKYRSFRNLPDAMKTVTLSGEKAVEYGIITQDELNVLKARDYIDFAAEGGYASQAVGYGSTALGLGAKALGDGNIAIGNSAGAVLGKTVGGTNNGFNYVIAEPDQMAASDAVNNISIGRDSFANGDNGIAIGTRSWAESDDSIAVGRGAVGNAGGIAVGKNSYSVKSGNIALGDGALADSGNSSLLLSGDDQPVHGNVALGADSVAPNDDNNVVSVGAAVGDEVVSEISGNVKTVTADKAFTRRIINVSDGIDLTDAVTVRQLNEAIAGVSGGGGSTSYVGINSATGGGNEDGSGATGTDAIAIGYDALSEGDNSVAIGKNASAGERSNYSTGDAVAIGTNAKAYSYGVVTGNNSEAGYYSFAAGNSASAGDNAVAINGAAANYSVAIAGYTQGERNTVISGSTNSDTDTENIVIGKDISGNRNTVIGKGEMGTVNGNENTVIGYEGNVSGKMELDANFNRTYNQAENVTSVGNRNKITGSNNIALGNNITIQGEEKDTYRFNWSSCDYGGSYYEEVSDNIVVGKQLNVVGNGNVLMTDNLITQGEGTVAIGQGAKVGMTSSNTLTIEQKNINKLAEGISTYGSFDAYAQHFIEEHNLSDDEARYVNRVIQMGCGFDIFSSSEFFALVDTMENGTFVPYEVPDATGNGDFSVAIGKNASAFGVSNAVAIGSESVATEENTVSVGNETIQRRIVNVAAGINDTDAVNVSQLNDAIAGVSGGGGATYTAGNNISIENNVVSAVGLIKYDDDTKKVATLEGGSRGTKLTNLSAATLSRTSTDAVIGNQLWTTNQNMAGMQANITTNTNNIASLNTSVSNALESVTSISTLVDTIDGLKADKSLNNLDAVGQQVIANAAANAVQEYMANNNKVVPMNKVVMNNVVPDDWSSIDDELALKANKDDVYTKDETDTMLDAKADVSYVDDQLSAKANVDDVYVKNEVDTMLGTKADADSVYTKDESDALLADKADKSELDAKADKADLEAKAEIDASNIDVEKWSEKLGTGAIEEGNTGLVNGGTVFEAIKNVGGNDMIKAGTDAIEIGSDTKYDGIDSVSIAKSDGSGRVLRGVVVDPEDDTSAVNVGYVKDVAAGIASGVNEGFSKLDNKINKTGAGAAALANLHPIADDGDTKWNIAAGIGRYHGESAGAVGVFYKPSDRVAVNISSTIGNSDTMFGAGVSVAIDKPMSNGLSKVQMAQAINNQAKTIQAQANQINAQSAEIKQMKQDYESRIARLEAALAKQK